MKTDELKEKLISEGCNESNFAVMGRTSDAFCLDKKGEKWSVFFCERGSDSAPIFSSDSEEETCEFFFNYIIKQQHWHIVGFFKNISDANDLEEKLTSIGVKPIRNDIPAYRAAGDLRHRVFVVGKDIFKVREHLGDIHVSFD
ncbi:MAG: SPOR domain-containing protein [Gammaproteobacteria bacterium]|nr:MAG: SPOR domain-containing protein [Gammaproteobacteria bacterium]